MPEKARESESQRLESANLKLEKVQDLDSRSRSERADCE